MDGANTYRRFNNTKLNPFIKSYAEQFEALGDQYRERLALVPRAPALINQPYLAEPQGWDGSPAKGGTCTS